jgi:hypothetical protein
VYQGSWPSQSEKRMPGNTNACQETCSGFKFLVDYQLNRFRQSKLLCGQSARKEKKICGLMYLFMNVMIPGTHRILLQLQRLFKTILSLLQCVSLFHCIGKLNPFATARVASQKTLAIKMVKSTQKLSS